MKHADFIVIGAGIAGASIAYHLAHHGKVVVLEQESQAGYHATGRSGAYFLELYGNQVIRSLTTASRAFFEQPPAGFCEYPLFGHGGSLHIADATQLERLEQLHAQVAARKAAISRHDADFALARIPILRQDKVSACLWDPSARAIDVDALLQGYLRGVRRVGGEVDVNQQVIDLVRDHEAMWTVTTRGGQYRAVVVINAAGAWADTLAHMAGVAPIGIEPRRRSAIIVDPGEGIDVTRWPLVLDIDEQFYFKPEAGKLMVSPADETLSPPTDAQPEDIDVATAAYRLEQVAHVQVSRIEHSWAGLRTFCADRTPLVDYDSEVGGFFWFVGQGGYGIQIAPALAEIGAARVLGQPMPGQVLEHGVNAPQLSIARLRATAADT